MQVSRAMLDGYTAQLDALSAAGQELVLNVLANAEWENIAELREIMCKAMDQVCATVADDAAVVAAEMYDDIREAVVGKRLGILPPSGYDEAATNNAVRALVQSVVDSDTTVQFRHQLADRVDYEVKRAAGEAAYRMGETDPLRVRFARVPSGSETCPFCIMLASRGPVYHSEKTAGGNGHYHAHCDCRIVPFYDTQYDGPSRRKSLNMEVQGYDPDLLYDRYVDDLSDGKLKLSEVQRYSTSHVQHWSSTQFESFGDFQHFIRNAKDIEDLQVRCAIVESEWKKTGLSNRYHNMLVGDVQHRRWQLQGVTDAKRVEYQKPRRELTDWERRCVDGLAKAGKRIVVNQEDPSAPANIDLMIDGELVELKNVTNIRSSVGNQISRARKKWWKHGNPEQQRTLFTMYGSEANQEEIAGELKKRMKSNETFYLLTESGELIAI